MSTELFLRSTKYKYICIQVYGYLFGLYLPILQLELQKQDFFKETTFWFCILWMYKYINKSSYDQNQLTNVCFLWNWCLKCAKWWTQE